RLPGLPPGARAAQLLDSNVPLPGSFLQLFGQPARESACECERSGGVMLGPVLALVNGPVIGDAIRDPENRITKLVATQPDDAKVVEELFLAILNRPPTAKELATGIEALKNADAEHAKLLAEYERRHKALTDSEKDLPRRQAEWEENLRKKTTTWTVLDPASMKSYGGADMTATGGE